MVHGDPEKGIAPVTDPHKNGTKTKDIIRQGYVGVTDKFTAKNPDHLDYVTSEFPEGNYSLILTSKD